MRYLMVAVAVCSGLLVLVGYLFPIPILVQARVMLTGWALVIGASAVVVGILNLVFVHLDKLRRREKNSLHGILLIISLGLTFVLGLLFNPSHPLIQATVNAVIVPVEASLMALLAVTLIYASVRLFRRQADLMSVLFLVVAIIFLTAVVLPSFLGSGLGELISVPVLGFLQVFSTGGARGLLIGIALGTLLTSLRVLFGIDRPYGGN